jgi:hypothetical protein
LQLPRGQVIGITGGPDGNVWFTELGVNSNGTRTGQIGRIIPGGQVSEFRIPTGGDSEPPNGFTNGTETV